MSIGSRLANTPYDQLTYQQRLMTAGDRARQLADNGGVMDSMAGTGGAGSPDDEESSIMGMMAGDEGGGQQQEAPTGGFTMGQSYAGANEYRKRMQDEARQRMLANRPGLEQREQERSDAYYRGTYGTTPAEVAGGGGGVGNGVMGMLAGRYPVVGAPGLPRRGYGGYGQGGLSFEERLALQNAGFQGRRDLAEFEQGNLNQRASEGVGARLETHRNPSGSAQLGATVRREENAQDAQMHREKMDLVLKRLSEANLQEATDDLNRLLARKAKRTAEIKARTGYGVLSPDDKVKGQQMPGHTAGEAALQAVEDQMIAAAKARIEQLTGGAGASAPAQ